MQYYDSFMTWLGEMYTSSWSWLEGLDRAGWLVLLAVGAGFGFLCMRGYGSRNNY
jgi:hypothetical protein